MPFSIMQNISVNSYGKYRKLRCFLDLAAERRHTENAMQDVRVKAPCPDAPCDTLLGGSQQKVVIARWLNHHTPILIFDEPTRGIDVVVGTGSARAGVFNETGTLLMSAKKDTTMHRAPGGIAEQPSA